MTITVPGIESIADYMAADFIESGCPAKVLFGKQYLTEHVEELRVVWVPTTDTFAPPLQIQSRGPSWPGNMGRGANPRPILTRLEGATLHIWGFAPLQGDPTDQLKEDFGILAALINQTILSLHRANPGNYAVTGGETKQELLWANRGIAYTLNVVVQVPVVDVAWNELVDGLTWTDVAGVTGDITVEELDASISFTAGPTGP